MIGLGVAILCFVALALRPAGADTPLDPFDPQSRSVYVQVESSANLSAVGQSFGPTWPATYAASGNTGTLVISIETHESIRTSGGSWTAVPGSFDPIVVQLDLTTLEATSQPAAGAIQSGQAGLSFTQNALDTTALAGFMGPDVPPFFCTSQQQVDDACLLVPLFCGQTCTIVPGSPYDPGTGRVNLVGSETQTGCDGAICDGPFDFFTGNGDLRLTEAIAPVPGLTTPASIALLALLAGVASAALRGRARDARVRRRP